MPKTIRNRLLAGFLFFSSISLFMILVNTYFTDRREVVNLFSNEIDKSYTHVLEDTKNIDDFFKYEPINEHFFESGQSDYINNHRLLVLQLNVQLDSLISHSIVEEINPNLLTAKELILQHDSIFASIVAVLKNRGFKKSGTEGKMRHVIHQIEKNPYTDLETVLMLRRHEKDFIIRNDEKYVNKFNSLASSFQSVVSNNMSIPSEKRSSLADSIALYMAHFNQLVELESKMGIKNNTALREQLAKTNAKILYQFKIINQITEAKKADLLSEIRMLYFVFAAFIIILSIVLSYLISRKASIVLTALSNNIEAFVSSSFRDKTKIDYNENSNDEISRLVRNYISMKREIHQLINQFQEKVEQRTVEIDRQKEHIERQNQKITESINAAKRIQNVILPDMDQLKNLFPDFFIYYRPKDIVSGDFYWFDIVDGKFIIAVADCTGHGVSGAFMSMLGSQNLNKIVHEKGITEVDEILNQLHIEIKQALRQEQTDIQDGMDIAVCSIDINENKIEFSGAKNPLLLIFCENDPIESPKEIYFKGDKFSIGGHKKEGERIFSKKVITIEEPCRVFLFSDGYKDQLGGDKYTKFMSKKFRQLLRDNSYVDFKTMESIIDQSHHSWKKSFPQTDDILIVGLQLEVNTDKREKIGVDMTYDFVEN